MSVHGSSEGLNTGGSFGRESSHSAKCCTKPVAKHQHLHPRRSQLRNFRIWPLGGLKGLKLVCLQRSNAPHAQLVGH